MVAERQYIQAKPPEMGLRRGIVRAMLISKIRRVNTTFQNSYNLVTFNDLR